jgi:amino acid transporter
MAELCSSMPTSGGLYYASAVLAPEGWGPFAAWITGWSNWFGQITAAPSGIFLLMFVNGELTCFSQLRHICHDIGSSFDSKPVLYTY